MQRVQYDWAAIQRYHDAGNDRDACTAKFGFRVAAWYKAISEGRLKPRTRRLVFDWHAIQEYYDVGHTYDECKVKFGFSPSSWSKAVRSGVISTRPKRFTLQRILTTSPSRASVKRR